MDDQRRDVINSCRICRTANQIGEFEGLYVEEEACELSTLGKLYVELLGIEIESDSMAYYPQYLCNSCELQMKLFKKLKVNALKTLEALERLYGLQFKKEIAKLGQDETFQLLEEDENNYEEDHISSTQAENGAGEVYLEEEYVEIDDLDSVTMKAELHEAAAEQHNWQPAANTDAEYDMSEYIEVETTRESPGSVEEAKSKDRDSKAEATTAAETDDNYCVDVLFLDDEEFVMEENLAEENLAEEAERNKTYPCSTCMLEFKSHVDFMQHRKKLHENKYPCTECSRILKTENALTVHLRRHRGLPLYKCEICQKTFNQKVHYVYHLNKHNNVRNFKCEVCGKSYLTKSDLNQHNRIHTGERPFACETCGKAFIILQHLKMHRYSHIGKTIECELCKLKFTAPSTLRLHMETIHVSEPRYPCEYCPKRFRRKHHLLAHYKVHQKSKKNYCEVEEFDADDIIDDCVEGNADEDYAQVPSSEQIDGFIVVDYAQTMGNNEADDNIDSDSILI